MNQDIAKPRSGIQCTHIKTNLNQTNIFKLEFIEVLSHWVCNAGAEVTSRPVSLPRYDPLMDEIFATALGEEVSREPLVSPKYVPPPMGHVRSQLNNEHLDSLR